MTNSEDPRRFYESGATMIGIAGLTAVLGGPAVTAVFAGVAGVVILLVGVRRSSGD